MRSRFPCSIAFSTQYQQSPIPPGGTIIKRKWLASYDAVPTDAPGDHLIMSWDVAFSEDEKGDYSSRARVRAANMTNSCTARFRLYCDDRDYKMGFRVVREERWLP